PGQAQAPLHRLVGVGVDAQGDRLGPVAATGELAAQQLRRVGLGEDLRLEVQARREVEVGVRGPGEAVAAAVLAAAVRVHRAGEAHVRRIVAADDAARGLLADLGARARRIGPGHGLGRPLPAVVHRLDRGLLETSGQVLPRAAALDRLGHAAKATAAGLSGCDAASAARNRSWHGTSTCAGVCMRGITTLTQITCTPCRIHTILTIFTVTLAVPGGPVTQE